MSDTKSVNIIARERVDSLATKNGESMWLKDSRVAAWEAYLQTAMPTHRDEDWRKTEIDGLDLSKLNAIDLSTQAEVEVQFPEWFKDALNRFPERAGFVAEVGNGARVELSDELKKQGVIFCTIKQALHDHQDLIRPFLKEKDDSGKFVLMNKALFNSGMFLYVPKNVEVKDPFISLTHFTSTNGTQNYGVAIFPRTIIVLGTHAKAQLVTCLSSESGSKEEVVAQPTSLANTVVEIHVEDGAHLEYLELQKFDDNVFSISRTENFVQKDASITSLTVGLSGAQLKGDIATNLDASGASSDLLGIVLGDKGEHFSFNTIQNHNAPDTKSNINFRVALKGDSQSIYQGVIQVEKVAQKTQAFQSNKNLLLGTEARADSIPRLEILADDVKCSHGATVGPVDREQVFYLMSRGLTAAQAEELIVTGFYRQILEACTITNAKDWIYDLLAEKIHQN